MTANPPAPEFSRLVAVERIDRRGLARTIAADPDERAALARRFGLIAIDSLEASIRLKAVNGGAAIRLDGHIEARVTQRCVVTLEPVPQTVESDFVLLFTREQDGEEVDLAFEDEVVEVLEGSDIDIGEAAAQELSVALDPYPRAASAQLEVEGLTDSVESLDGEAGGLQETAEPEKRPSAQSARPRATRRGRDY